MRTIQLWLPIIALVPAMCSVNGGFSPAVTPSAAPEARQAGARERVIYSFQSGADGADPLELWLPIAEARSMERPRSAEVEAALTAAGRSSN